MADYRYCLGTVTKPTSNGSQVVTGIADAQGAFTPVAVVFFSTTQNTEGFAENALMTHGFSDGTAHRAVSCFNPNNIVGARGCRSYVTNAACLAYCTAAQTVISDTATVSAMASGSFTLDWAASATAWKVHYLALGGADLQAKVVSVVAPSSPGTQTVSGLGIGQITGLLTLGVLGTGEASLGVTAVAVADTPAMGWCDTSLNQHAIAVHADDFPSTSGTCRYQRTDQAMVQFGTIPNDSQLEGGACTVTSLDADGFTLNWTNTSWRQDLSGGPGMHVLAISGPQVVAGTFTQGDPSLSFGTTPGALLVATVGATASVSVQAENRWSLGAVTPDALVGLWTGDLNAQTTSASASAYHSDVIIVSADPDTTTASSVINATVLPVLTTSGATLTWPTNDHVGRELLYLTFQGATIPPAPFPPLTSTTVPMRKLRRSTTFSTEKFWNFFTRFQLDFQAGGPRDGNAPIEICLRYSDDNGNTWSDEMWQTVDARGNYLAIAQWFQLGRGRDRVWEVSSTSEAMTVWLAAYLDVVPGTHG